MTMTMTNTVETIATVRETSATENGAVLFVPFNKLKKSPRNARKTPHSEAHIEALAASIAAKGMLQNLVVEPETNTDGELTGFYFVTIGEGRRLAQMLRVKRKQIKKSEPIRCVLDTENDATEISLDENVTREAMHPADQFERFRELAENRGWGAEEIAARFGVTAHVVRQRLRLGAVSPKLMQVYRDGGLSLDQLMAFAITEDHDRQEQVYENLSWNRDPSAIRRDLTRMNVAATDRRAIFVGADAYAEAGGFIIRDLFTEDRGGYFEDAALLERLVIDKLEGIAAEVQAVEGWKWASVHIDFPHAHGMRRSYPHPVDLSADADDDARPLTGERVEPMRLRPEPPRVTRLSRKVLIALGLLAGTGIGGTLIYALQTQRGGKTNEELYSTDNRTTPDGLAGLPKDYTGIPKLGPPLPGDLGRPILSAQNAGQPVPTPGIATPNPGISQEEQRRIQELEAARTARLFASTETRPANTAAPQPQATVSPQADLASLGLAPPPATPSAQDRQLAFLNQAPDKRTVSPDRVAAPASANVLQAGAVIAVALITGIRSDLPGQITAQVTENVYDSPTGRILLLPQGTRIIGQYGNGVGFGQRRVLLVWNRLIFPNGRSIVLERQPGADAEGYAGLEDGVDYHWGELFKAAALSTLLSVGAEAGSSGQESDVIRALRNGASDSINQTGQQIVQHQLNIAPTLTIRPSFPVRVIVTRDLVLEPYGG